MIKIDRLVLRIPASMKPRAAELARQAAYQLAIVQQTSDQHIDTVKPEPLQVRPETSTAVIARRISETIQNHIDRARGES